MKKLDKQIVSALAIGIGAGLMMCPVTVYADAKKKTRTTSSATIMCAIFTFSHSA